MTVIKMVGLNPFLLGRCDYCGTQRALDTTVTGSGLQAHCCARCDWSPTEIPLPLAIWARERAIENIEWREPQHLLSEGDTFTVGNVTLESVAVPDGDKLLWAGGFWSPGEQRTVVYWYEAEAGG